MSQNEEVCTGDASPSSSSSKNLDNISMSPLYFCSLFLSRRIALVDFLGALDDEEFFVVEGSGVSLPGDLPPISLSGSLHR